MKKLLLFSMLLLSLHAFSQRHASAAEQLKTAQSFLINEPCNTTGIAWVKSVLEKEPENKAALEIISNCDRFSYAKAKELFDKEPTSLKGRELIQGLLLKDPDNEELNFLLAQSNFVSGPSHYVKKYISKAITANPSNLEYRWIRVRCNLMTNSTKEDFEQAIRDLKYMIENGAATGKVYLALYTAENNLARSWESEPIPVNSSWTDDRSAEEAAKEHNKRNAEKHYKNAEVAGLKAVEINPEYAKEIGHVIIGN